MTLPTVPDLVLFHAIATRIVARAQRRRRRHRHVYFMRDRISKVQKEAFDDATKKIREDRNTGRASTCGSGFISTAVGSSSSVSIRSLW